MLVCGKCLFYGDLPCETYSPKENNLKQTQSNLKSNAAQKMGKKKTKQLVDTATYEPQNFQIPTFFATPNFSNPLESMGLVYLPTSG